MLRDDRQLVDSRLLATQHGVAEVEQALVARLALEPVLLLH